MEAAKREQEKARTPWHQHEDQARLQQDQREPSAGVQADVQPQDVAKHSAAPHPGNSVRSETSQNCNETNGELDQITEKDDKFGVKFEEGGDPELDRTGNSATGQEIVSNQLGPVLFPATSTR